MANFQCAIGIIDASHIRIIAPTANEWDFMNRKRYHSMNVHGICDHRGYLKPFYFLYAAICKFNEVYFVCCGNFHACSTYLLFYWLYRPIALTSQILTVSSRCSLTISVRVQRPHTAQKLTILIQNYYKVLQNLLCLQKLYYA
jgi:hypothetical protein